jgi:Protein of unknown function (DUF2711)
MDYSQLWYPNHETPLLQAYDGRFSAAFIALHPFFCMPTSLDWEPIDSGTDYPDAPYIRQYGQPVYWQTIMQAIGCNDLRRFYIGMRTSILALKQEYEDREITRLINEYTEQEDIYHPTEGRMEALLIEPISQYISHEQTEEIFYLAEFETEPKVLSVEAVIQECDRWLRGSLFDVKVTRLATVDWDDFFTVIYGSREQLASLLENKPLEGFFCDDQTLHTWCWQDRLVKPVV